MKDLAIEKLVAYARQTGLIEAGDETWAVNTLLDALGLSSYTPSGAPVTGEIDLARVLDELTDDAAARGLLDGSSITERDLFDTMLMGRITPRPAQVTRQFRTLYAQSPRAATDWYYRFSQDTNYIRRDRIVRDMQVGRSHRIRRAGYHGEPLQTGEGPQGHRRRPGPARRGAIPCASSALRTRATPAGWTTPPGSHRIIPITIHGAPWFLQYSPYVYYNEHCICLNAAAHPHEDRPGLLCASCWTLSASSPTTSWAPTPTCPSWAAPSWPTTTSRAGATPSPWRRPRWRPPSPSRAIEDVRAGIVKWPMSVIRLTAPDPERLVDLADRILTAWRGYTDEEAVILAETDGVPHNTITPIARRRGEDYELDLVLRNNLTTPEHPLGLYHPHAELHHIKKENIGLIEVMGLAVLPARLKEELAAVADALVRGADLRADERTVKHADWAEGFRNKYGTIDSSNALDIVQKETGLVFAQVLEHAGVYRRDAAGREAFLRFIRQV